MNRNLHTLLSDPTPLEDIPVYPTVEILTAKGGEVNNKLVPATKNSPMMIKEYKAKKGELLRDVDMRFKGDVEKNIDFRIERRMICDRDPAMREIEMQYCASDILYFANVWCWTHNPWGSVEDRDIPFVTYPFQDDWLTWRVWCTKNRVDNLTEKSREQGLSWLIQVLHVWLAIFYKGTTTYQLSMKEKAVDNRTVDSLIGKARFLLRNLPEWMRGSWVENSNLCDQNMKIVIPKTQSVIRGETTNTAGRSGRATVADFDEFAHVEGSEAVAEACSSLAGSISYISTVNGMGNQFAKMAHRPGTHKKSFHWTLHPLKNDEWALTEKEKPKYADESVWAQEQDINYQKSKSGRVFPMFVSEAHDNDQWSHVQVDDWFEYDPRYPVYVGFDPGIGDPSSAVFFQKREAPARWKSFTQWTWVMIDQKEDRQGLMDEPKWAEFFLEYIANGVPITGIILDPRYGFARQMDKRTWYSAFKEKGLPVVKNDREKEDATILNMKSLLNKPGRFCIHLQRCGWAVEVFQNWAWDKIDPESRTVLPGAHGKHDKYSHCMKAILYLMEHYDNEVKEYEKSNITKRNRRKFNWSFKA